MVKWYDRIGNTIEMYVNDTWTKGTVINGERTGDGIVNMETSDGEKYWCGVCSGYYKKASDSLEDLFTQGDKIRAMTDEELAEFLQTTVAEFGDNLFKCSDYYKSTLCKGGACDTCGAYLEWLKSEVKE